MIEFNDNTASPVVADLAMSGYYYKKTKLSYSEGFESNWHRVSATVGPEKKDSIITVGKDYTFHGSITGNVYGISTIGVGVTVCKKVSYSLTVPAGKVMYLGFKVWQKTEKGTRVKYNMNTRKKVSSNKYTVKKNYSPTHGRYHLLKDKRK